MIFSQDDPNGSLRIRSYGMILSEKTKGQRIGPGFITIWPKATGGEARTGSGQWKNCITLLQSLRVTRSGGAFNPLIPQDARTSRFAFRMWRMLPLLIPPSRNRTRTSGRCTADILCR